MSNPGNHISNTRMVAVASSLTDIAEFNTIYLICQFCWEQQKVSGINMTNVFYRRMLFQKDYIDFAIAYIHTIKPCLLHLQFIGHLL